MARKLMTYTDVETLLASRFPSATVGDEEAEANHRVSWSGPSYSNYLLPRPMSETVASEASTRGRKDSTSSNPKRATLKKRRTFSDASLRQKAALSRTQSSDSFPEEPVAGPSRLPPIPTFASALSSQHSNGLSELYSHSQPTYHHSPVDNVGDEFPGFSHIDSFRSYVSSGTYYKPLSKSSTLRSRPKTPATVSTRIDEQEFLDLADFVYTTPTPTMPPVPSHGPSGYSAFGRTHSEYNNGRNQVDEIGPFSPTVVDSAYSEASPEVMLRVAADNQSTKSSETIYGHSAHLARSRRSQDTLEGWAEYVPDTQSLRTISKRPAFHTHSTSNFSRFSDFEAIDVREAYLVSDCSTPTAIGMGLPSPSSTRRFSLHTPPHTPTLIGTPAATWRMSGGSEGTWRTLVNRKAFSRSKGKSSGLRGRPSLSALADPQPVELSKPGSHHLSPLSSPVPSCRTIELDINPPASSKGSTFEMALSDLDYDYGLALDVLVLGSVNFDNDAETFDYDKHNSIQYPFDIPAEMDILPPPTDPDKTSLTTFDTEIIFKRFKNRSASLNSISSASHAKHPNRSHSSKLVSGPTLTLPEGTSVSTPQTDVIKQRRSFFSQVSHIFARG